MPKDQTTPWAPANAAGLARQFWRLGWIGFWIQLTLLAVSAALLIYVVAVTSDESAQRRGVDLGYFVSQGSVLILFFTTFVLALSLWLLFRVTRSTAARIG